MTYGLSVVDGATDVTLSQAFASTDVIPQSAHTFHKPNSGTEDPFVMETIAFTFNAIGGGQIFAIRNIDTISASLSVSAPRDMDAFLVFKLLSL